MNKQDVAAVVVLFLLLIGWTFFQKGNAREQAEAPAEAVAENAERGPVSGAHDPSATAGGSSPTEETVALPAEPAEEIKPATPEKITTLSNGVLRVSISSWSGAISSATLMEYRETVDPESGPVVLDFENDHSLMVEGIPGIPGRNGFSVAIDEPSNSVSMVAVAANGLELARTIELGSDYTLVVKDKFTNRGGKPLELPRHGTALGSMHSIQTEARMRGISYLGLDTLAMHGGEPVRHWLKQGFFSKSDIYRKFSEIEKEQGKMPVSVSHQVGQPVEWAAAKNKFFVQVLIPENGADDCELRAARNPAAGGKLDVSTASASALFKGAIVAPGDSAQRKITYYVGPKEYSRIKDLGPHQGEIMEFGKWFGWMCRILLPTLNKIHDLIPNYGVAIIILTALVRIMFWPITHKSTEGMKKLQKLQPMVAEIKEKHKDNPKKIHEETMALYKEQKVNPMSGCLPMLIQIPVFIALFTVLRSAVELRFADFLWIKDLSEPEGLFSDTLPIALNILPILMTATTFLQQKFTSGGGDPQQQRMMMFMPLVMLFIFYNMPSALTLYWTTSQLIAVAQLGLQRVRSSEA